MSRDRAFAFSCSSPSGHNDPPFPLRLDETPQTHRGPPLRRLAARATAVCGVATQHADRRRLVPGGSCGFYLAKSSRRLPRYTWARTNSKVIKARPTYNRAFGVTPRSSPVCEHCGYSRGALKFCIEFFRRGLDQTWLPRGRVGTRKRTVRHQIVLQASACFPSGARTMSVHRQHARSLVFTELKPANPPPQPPPPLLTPTARTPPRAAEVPR
ncbi:MAG: hypothetical protein BJ554DRAFT_4424 [Olpidium bornovanus]|uniref:Uncharacterized protein n=1 Tax=Olpidium bornovanus TaxID=278681 RepID=A0A8H7ZM78_9FUNG|nr:MAG: hypothetical protein BJ554DRAFT_4424 [Olpidium bornovanus]